ncbi:MAG: hypothetical protein RBU30_00270 [Polyangia bacterium]|nr:hypothetical protein [Polyangia bacterium]
MSDPLAEREAWRRTGKGLALARRGISVVAASGLAILLLGAAGRAGCSDPSLPEVRSLMRYQDLLFHLSLWLGFVMVQGGLLWAWFLPASGRERVLVLVPGLLTAVAFLLFCLVARPGQVAEVGGPFGDSWVLIAAVLGTAALSGSCFVAMLAVRRLGSRAIFRGAPLLGPALLLVAAVNAEAASGLLFATPMSALYALGAIAAVNAAVGFWVHRLLKGSEELIRRRLAEPEPTESSSDSDKWEDPDGSPRQSVC